VTKVDSASSPADSLLLDTKVSTIPSVTAPVIDGGARDLRTLVVMHLPEISGPSRSLETELEWLASQGTMEVLLPDIGPGRLFADFQRFAKVRSVAYATLTVPSGAFDAVGTGYRFRRGYRLFREAIRRSGANLVVVTSVLLPTALMAARAEGVRSVLYAGEILDEPRVASRSRAWGGERLLAFAARTASGIIACSERVARQYRERGARRVQTISPPIAARYTRGSGSRFRGRHGIPPDAPLVVAVGAITEGRAQDVLVHAMTTIRQTVPDAHLAIVGDPHPRPVDRAYAAEIRRLAQLLVPGGVTFSGFEEHVEDAYAAASVVANPSRYEGFGRVAFEAAVAGRPMVSTFAGAIPEVLHEGSEALLVPPDRPGELADAVVRLLKDMRLAAQLADAGGLRARTEMAPSGALDAFQQTIEASLKP
jgi:glycosyltransferase involved in cell wall biosynthesis